LIAEPSAAPYYPKSLYAIFLKSAVITGQQCAAGAKEAGATADRQQTAAAEQATAHGNRSRHTDGIRRLASPPAAINSSS
jgi:hypothetical protein